MSVAARSIVDELVALRFQPLDGGREHAWLGVHMVGWIKADDHGCGNWRATWLCYLPGPFGPQPRPHRAASLQAARDALTEHVADWIDAGGLGFTGARAGAASFWRDGAR